MDGDLVPAMGVVAEEATALGLPRPVVTSGNDSTQHVLVPRTTTTGRSTSVGTTSLTHKGEQWAARVQERLGPSYAVGFERFPDNPARDHLHVAKRRKDESKSSPTFAFNRERTPQKAIMP
jgi:conjugal transfer mating pair stabilization protein TraG